MSEEKKHEFDIRPETSSRLRAISEKGYIVVVTQAYGPNGEDLMDHSGRTFSGEPGGKLRFTQADKTADAFRGPFLVNPPKFTDGGFKAGRGACLSVRQAARRLDQFTARG